MSQETKVLSPFHTLDISGSRVAEYKEQLAFRPNSQSVRALLAAAREEARMINHPLNVKLRKKAKKEVAEL